jgi:phage terminase large subunit-like protein
LYPKHLEHFKAGAEYNERLLMAGNRCGKTDAGVYETVLHLTGNYPHWWEGKRFDRAIKAWACSDTNKTAKEVLQDKLLGPLSAPGTGFIPAAAIVHRTSKAGLAEAVDTIYVKHVSGGSSSVQIKSYQEGRESFQGAAIDFVHLDETPGIAIYAECLLRTLTTGGHLVITMTPLAGLDELVLSFLPEGLPPG